MSSSSSPSAVSLSLVAATAAATAACLALWHEEYRQRQQQQQQQQDDALTSSTRHPYQSLRLVDKLMMLEHDNQLQQQLQRRRKLFMSPSKSSLPRLRPTHLSTSSSSGSNHSRWSHDVPPAAATTVLDSLLDLWNALSGVHLRTQNNASGPKHTRSLRRHGTLKRMESMAELNKLESRYEVDWKHPLGEGSFGVVYVGKNRQTGERVAIKKISKRHTDNLTFQREIDALLHLRQAGGHPNICGLQENFNEDKYFYLVLDLICGGEMFDHLCKMGAYSEADAARLVREITSALAFMHGIGIVHADLKPENLMLSSDNPNDAVIQVVDFGCAQVNAPDDDNNNDDDAVDEFGNKESNMPHHHHSSTTSHQASPRKGTANTPAYSPPEALSRKNNLTILEPSFDMWSLGVIIYIMLTGVHPFDLYGNATDAEIEHQVLSGQKPPLRRSPLTAHLSEDAIAIIEKLIQWDPEQRLTAQELLEEPWVRGKTARKSKMADSDKRLNAYRAFKTRIEANVFSNMLTRHDLGVPSGSVGGESDVAKKTSLIEHAFRNLDPELKRLTTGSSSSSSSSSPLTWGRRRNKKKSQDDLSLSGFSDLISDNMKNRYWPKGTIVYREGERGDAMYFLNSGSIEVYTRDGFNKSIRRPGDFFGEGALLHPKKIRSASIRCITPVHAIEISREYFEKYMASSEGEDAKLNLQEIYQARKRQRAKSILRLQQSMIERVYRKGDYLFKAGDEGKELYILEEGTADIQVHGQTVETIRPGGLTGEHSLIFGHPRNVSTVCTSDFCKVHVLRDRDFFHLLDNHPDLKESVRDICLRREFQKAVCFKTKRPFPKEAKELREVFDMVDNNNSGELELENIRSILRQFDPTYGDSDIRDILDTLDLNKDGLVSWAEFKRMFGMDDESK